MADIRDFGEKIGGARKDVWKSRGLIFEDLSEMNAMERKTNIKKDNIWIRPNWEQLIADGAPQEVAYWQNHMRQSLPPRPPADDEETQNRYVEVVGQIRDAVMAVQDSAGIDSFYATFLRPTFCVPEARYGVTLLPGLSGILTRKVFSAAQEKSWRMKRDAEKKLFGVPKEDRVYTSTKAGLSVHEYDGERVTLDADARESSTTVLRIRSTFGTTFYYLRAGDAFHNRDEWKPGTFFVMHDPSRNPLKINFESREAAEAFIEALAKKAQEAANEREASGEKAPAQNRKGAFVPPQLRHIQRTGPEYRAGRNATGDLFLKDMLFRGGEFGNWLNDRDRQTSMNMAYDAFRDMARLLHMRPEDVSLNKTLAIAFGARGKGGAAAGAAHYEPDRQVINLTKMSGAGCLAHEWGHALDHAIGIAFGETGFATERKVRGSVPATFRDLVDSLKYKTVALSADELRAEQAPEIERCRKGMKGWLDSVKPSKLTDEQKAKWEELSDRILNNAGSFSGVEYVRFGRLRTSPPTHDDVEALSALRKSITNHVIPLDTKRQIALWAAEINRHESALSSPETKTRRVKTDFYKGSIEFDNIFSRGGHGYWQSDCEMFARAFDCYITDKIREAGVQSDYLSARADSFAVPDGKGGRICAFPEGEERARLNEMFDALIVDLKERGILHEFEEPELTTTAPTRGVENSSRRAEQPEEPAKPVRYEQLSLDEQLFAAEAQRQAGGHAGRGRDRGFDREL